MQSITAQSNAHGHGPAPSPNGAAAGARSLQRRGLLAGLSYDQQVTALTPGATVQRQAHGQVAGRPGPRRPSPEAQVADGAGTEQQQPPEADNAQVEHETPGASRSTPGRRRRGVTPAGLTMNFEDEPVQGHVFVLGGRRPYDVIQDYVNAMAMALQQMKDGALGAIQSFVNRMNFSSSADASPNALGTMFSTVGSQLWEAALGQLSTLAGLPKDFGLKQAFKVVSAVASELERAARAQASVNAGNFVEALRSQATSSYQAQIAEVMTQGPVLMGHYSGLEGEEGANVTGAKARLLGALHSATQRLPRVIPQPSAYEAQFIARYVRQTGGSVLVSYRTSESNGAVDLSLESSTLVGSPHAGHAADMMTSVMRQLNKRVWQMGVPVTVRLHGPLVAGGSGYTSYVVDSHGPDPSRGVGWETMDRRWRALCAERQLHHLDRISG